jgi:predicted  nucleic acid-binding Zn-ribbon protein
MLSETRENIRSARKLVDDLQEIEEVVESAPGIVQDAERLVGRVEDLENQVRRLTDEVQETTEEIQLRVEMRVEIAGTVAFATLAAERYAAGNEIGMVGFSALAALFFLAFFETLVKKKRDLGHFF